ncbi:outer membrane transport energization protein ExbB (TC 2.C.1.1.1) [Solimonas aquatica]|uniref:Outer membrane transport energization protein ExbB (TC 2.C.1.1.1) n=1 Tax=Solimonas aquatica TaxID=489703 RepID=A0A1H9DVU8_9GAMM|nr:MotA/TolQ/ExbB proton channel family protein [Solimonas aquatica]SEQ16993.1 outer membrane transport energization protein ExbB (TC 2.C.1.1.1) [Solimonas aquatica]
MIDTSSIPAVPATLWALGAFSAATWTLIAAKGVQYWRLRRGNRRYQQAFWAASDLNQAAAELDHSIGAVARLAGAGFKALGESSEQHADLEHAWDRRDLLERQLRRQIHGERRTLESGLSVLASIGSTSPFVGLFGTVWGIMNALTHIGSSGQVSLEAVAGPIGEALIATGFGIATAVPAVLGYNYFLRKLKLIVADLDDFAHDFLNLSQRAGFRVQLPPKSNNSRGAQSAAAAPETRGAAAVNAQGAYA